MIRIATLDDRDVLKDMSIKFVNLSPYKDLYSEEDIQNEIDFLLTTHRSQGVMFITEGGMLGGKITKFPFGPHLLATEVAWWVDEDKRKNGIGQQLLDHYEMWAAIAGAKIITMGSLDDLVGKFYEKNGYVLCERAYMKVI